jgi:hypothetical protein
MQTAISMGYIDTQHTSMTCCDNTRISRDYEDRPLLLRAGEQCKCAQLCAIHAISPAFTMVRCLAKVALSANRTRYVVD